MMDLPPTSCLSEVAHNHRALINQWADNPEFVVFAHRLQDYLYKMQPGSSVTTMPKDPDRQPWAVAVMADHLCTNYLQFEFSDDYSTFLRLRC